MNIDNQSSLKELYDLFVKYNAAQVFYVNVSHTQQPLFPSV